MSKITEKQQNSTTNYSLKTTTELTQHLSDSLNKAKVLDYMSWRCLHHCPALCIHILRSNQASGLRCSISNITFITARARLSHENRKDNSGVGKESRLLWTQLTAAGRQTAQHYVSVSLLKNYYRSLQNNNRVDKCSIYPVACKEMWGMAVNTWSKRLYYREHTSGF